MEILVILSLAATACLTYSIILYVRNWRWDNRFVHTLAKITDRYDSPQVTLRLAFPALGAENNAEQVRGLEALKDAEPLEIVEVSLGWLDSARLGKKQELMIMFPPGNPQLAQLQRTCFIQATLWLFAFFGVLVFSLSLIGVATSFGNMLVK
jgi:hypothetical protein